MCVSPWLGTMRPRNASTLSTGPAISAQGTPRVDGRAGRSRVSFGHCPRDPRRPWLASGLTGAQDTRLPGPPTTLDAHPGEARAILPERPMWGSRCVATFEHGGPDSKRPGGEGMAPPWGGEAGTRPVYRDPRLLAIFGMGFSRRAALPRDGPRTLAYWLARDGPSNKRPRSGASSALVGPPLLP